jgi:hypothetical protein
LFTGEHDAVYSYQIAVYTDGSYSAYDSNYAPSSNTFISLADVPDTSGRLKGKVFGSGFLKGKIKGEC